MSDEGPLSEETLAEIHGRCSRSRSRATACKQITHKLLSFARKTDPTIKPVDLNSWSRRCWAWWGKSPRYARG